MTLGDSPNPFLVASEKTAQDGNWLLQRVNVGPLHSHFRYDFRVNRAVIIDDVPVSPTGGGLSPAWPNALLVIPPVVYSDFDAP